MPLEMNGGTKTGVRVQTASKTEVRETGFPPAPRIEEEEEHYGVDWIQIEDIFLLTQGTFQSTNSDA
jgi:hypothetical protein